MLGVGLGRLKPKTYLSKMINSKLFNKLNIILNNLTTISIGKYRFFVNNIIPDGESVRTDNIKIEVENFEVKDAMNVEHAEILVPSIQCEFKHLLSVIDKIKECPPQICNMVAHFSMTIVNRLLKHHRELLDIPEIQELQVNVKNGKIHVTGKGKKILTVPFLTVIDIYLLEDRKKIKINVEKVQVLNFIPVPGFGLSFVMDIMSKKLALKFIEHQGTAFIVDTAKILPVPVDMNFKAIEMDEIYNRVTVKI